MSQTNLPRPLGTTSTTLDLSASVGISLRMSLPSFDSSGSLEGRAWGVVWCDVMKVKLEWSKRWDLFGMVECDEIDIERNE